MTVNTIFSVNTQLDHELTSHAQFPLNMLENMISILVTVVEDLGI
jgi:hypothetical protein